MILLPKILTSLKTIILFAQDINFLPRRPHTRLFIQGQLHTKGFDLDLYKVLNRKIVE